ncbi:integral membrane protein [Sarocladium implicatum]|nr:integral membrane protein [Sarocladium implicatum]
MDPANRTDATDHEQQQHLAVPASSTSRAASPSPSHASNIPATPRAEPDASSDYFAPLATGRSHAASIRSAANSTRSRASAGVYGQADSLEQLRQPSIRIRRKSSTGSQRPRSTASNDGPSFGQSFNNDPNRPRSLSQPERAHLPPDFTQNPRYPRRVQDFAMPRLTEEGNRPTMEELREARSPNAALSPTTSLPEHNTYDDEQLDEQEGRGRRFRGRRLWPAFGRKHDRTQASPDPQQQAEAEYDEALVDWLDTIDPEVQTLSTLTNVQNSLFVPDLGNWVNRRPTYSLSQHQMDTHVPRPHLPQGAAQAQSRLTARDQTQLPVVDETAAAGPFDTRPGEGATGGLQRTSTITSQLTDSHYAALPHGESLEGWTAEEKWELDDHVRHMLHSRRSRMKRRLKGFGQYVSRPLGFLVTLYAVLITLFGLAWVLFMIGWIYVGDRQKYIIHVVDSVLVALFAIMGDGLAPFRAIDTYRLFFIVRYTRIIENAKKGKFPRQRARLQKQNIPPEVRESMDLAAAGRVSLGQAPGLSQGPRRPSDEISTQFPRLEDDEMLAQDRGVDLEDRKPDDADDWMSVLSPKQLKRLVHHKKKMAKSHSFYKPQETYTHNAFPLSYLIAIVILLDCHSCLQISLGATTWGIDYKTRNPAITTVILCLSITCNITAGLVISRGDKISRKKDVVKLLDRQALTGDAIKHMEKKKKGDSGEDTDLSRDPSGSKLEQRTDSPDSEDSAKGKLKKKSLVETESKESQAKLTKKA